MSPLNETWLYWADGAHTPYFNMAIDETILNTIKDIQHVVLRTYLWDRPAVSIGFAQRWGITPPEFTCVRRPTGGGVVFHHHDITYTLIFPAGHPLEKCSREESYAIIHEALASEISALGHAADLLPQSVDVPDHSVMQCFQSPSKYDVMDAGEKAAGAAQRRTPNGVLHQGSILRSVTKGNIPQLISLICKSFSNHFNIKYQSWKPSEALIQSAELLAATKYQSDKWSLKRRFEASQTEPQQ